MKHPLMPVAIISLSLHPKQTNLIHHTSPPFIILHSIISIILIKICNESIWWAAGKPMYIILYSCNIIIYIDLLMAALVETGALPVCCLCFPVCQLYKAKLVNRWFDQKVKSMNTWTHKNYHLTYAAGGNSWQMCCKRFDYSGIPQGLDLSLLSFLVNA